LIPAAQGRITTASRGIASRLGLKKQGMPGRQIATACKGTSARGMVATF
jgi:hypothetical protein